MGNGEEVLAALERLPVRPKPTEGAMRPGVRVAEEGRITVREWPSVRNGSGTRPAPVVEQLPTRVFD